MSVEQLSTIGGPVMPTASDVKVILVVVGGTSATRATALTPTSGTRVRILSARVSSLNLSTDPDEVEVYFGTGATIKTTVANAIGVYSPGVDSADSDKWPDGSGPIGDTNEVVSWRTLTETETGLQLIVIYREEL